MSMDAAGMDLSQVFEFGQGYVALSRVRRLSGLYLLGINEHALKVHPEILEKDIDFKSKSEEAAQVFGKISESEMKKMHDDFVVAVGGKVREEQAKPKKNFPGLRFPGAPHPGQTMENFSSVSPFEKIREKHPNAY